MFACDSLMCDPCSALSCKKNTMLILPAMRIISREDYVDKLTVAISTCSPSQFFIHTEISNRNLNKYS